jgi:nitroreductase
MRLPLLSGLRVKWQYGQLSTIIWFYIPLHRVQRLADMIELLRSRRSIRKYEDRPIESAKVEILKEALLRAPSSRGLDPWEFVLVDDRETLAKLARCKPHGAAFLQEAALGIVVCGDSNTSDTWIEDCSIASILVQIVAQSIGLGSCWVQVRLRSHDDELTAEQYVQDLLSIPEHMRVESIISIGYPGESKEPIPGEKLKHDKIRMNRFE